MSFIILLGMSFQFGYNIGVLNQPVQASFAVKLSILPSPISSISKWKYDIVTLKFEQ